MSAYYNEFKPEAAHMLRQLIKDGLIAPGEVDERSITEVSSDDIRGFTQVHFFAGVGGWSVALRLAGWDDSRPVWTGSCPCQPFSSAGKQKGKADERHLWPVWAKLIRDCRPPHVFGEQVASAIRHEWWDDVADDLESEGYATRAEVRSARGVGALHLRERLFFNATNDVRKRIERERKEPIYWEQRLQSCENVRRIEDLRKRTDIYPPTLCSADDGLLGKSCVLDAFGNAIVPQVAAQFIKATGV